MALARVKTWNAGDTLTAADLNAEFNNILNNPTALINLSAAGDVCIVSSAAAVSRLAIGTAGQILSVSTASLPVWGGSGGAGSRVKGLVGSVTSSQTVSLAFTQCILQTTAANPTSFVMSATSSFNMSVGTAGSAVNGRDVAAAFSSTFINAFAISTGSGSTASAGILSSSLVPVLPTSYSAYAYLGTYPYSSSSTTFSYPQRVQGAFVEYDLDSSGATRALTAGTATTFTAVSFLTLVPTISLRPVINAAFKGTHNADSDQSAFIRPTGSASTAGTLVAEMLIRANESDGAINIFEYPLGTSQALDYRLDVAPNVSGGLNLDAVGYIVPNGDV